MSYSDDDLDDLIRRSRPAAGDRNDASGAAAIAIRESIIRGTYGARRRVRGKRLVWAGLSTAVTAVLIAVVVATAVLIPSQRAVALTPPPLHYSPSAPLDDVLRQAQAQLSSEPDILQDSKVASAIWGWNVEMATAKVEIVPQRVTFEWAPGQPSTTTVYAGESYWSDNVRPDGVEPSPYKPGQLIEKSVMPAEDLALPPAALNLTGSSRDGVAAALAAFGATPESSSGDLLAAITGLLQYWTLDDAQHATLLAMLDETDELSVRGLTTDRLGRSVIGVEVSQVIPDRQETFFISTTTGRIVGVESELLKPLEGLPAGVITYTMWDAD